MSCYVKHSAERGNKDFKVFQSRVSGTCMSRWEAFIISCLPQ